MGYNRDEAEGWVCVRGQLKCDDTRINQISFLAKRTNPFKTAGALFCDLFYGALSNSDHTASNGIRLAHFISKFR